MRESVSPRSNRTPTREILPRPPQATDMERQQIIALFLVVLMVGSMLAYAALLI